MPSSPSPHCHCRCPTKRWKLSFFDRNVFVDVPTIESAKSSNGYTHFFDHSSYLPESQATPGTRPKKAQQSMFRDINWILLAFVLCFVEHVGGFVQVPASAVLSSSSSIRDVISNLRDASATGNPARSSRISLRSSVSQGSAEWKQAGPDSPKPVYDDSGWFDRTALGIFRGAMVKSLGEDVPTEGYAGLMELALKLNQKFTAGDPSCLPWL